MVNLDKISTEQRNAASEHIDKVSTLDMVTIINNEDKKVPEAVSAILPAIAQAVDLIGEHLNKGGRLFYVGSGTSGRLGVLDAAECPPTYSTAPEMVQGLIAGGEQAMFIAQEGAEDSEQLGREDLQGRKLTGKDVVVGLTASGRTPYVIGALRYAKTLGVATISIACSKDPEVGKVADISLVALVGPEVVTGSTRMKAGTAQKLILNMLSTGAMIKLGKVYSNLMVDVKPTNLKLKERARRIVMTLADCDKETAHRALLAVGGKVRTAVELIKGEHNDK